MAGRAGDDERGADVDAEACAVTVRVVSWRRRFSKGVPMGGGGRSDAGSGGADLVGRGIRSCCRDEDVE